MPDIKPMSVADKLRALATMADQGREADVYSGIEFLLKERQWPEWLRSGITQLQLDVPRDRPVNLKEAA